MRDRVVIPRRALNDRRVKGTHLRVLAALASFGGGSLAAEKVASEAGVDTRHVQRALGELESWLYLFVTRKAGHANSYRIVFSEDGTAETAGPAENAVTPPAPLSSPPKDPTPQNTPPLIPPPPPEKRARGTRLPEDWQPSPSNIEFAKERGLDATAVAEEFRDYWYARAGPDARKVDWSRTWQTWCRRAAEKRGSNGRAQVLDFTKPTEADKRAAILGPLAAAVMARRVASGGTGSG